MNKFQKVMIVSTLIIVFIAWMDINGFRMWQLLGGFESANYDKADESYLKLFWNFSYGLIVITGIIYYIMKRDLSEAIAIMSMPVILLQFGVEDWLYYKMQQIPFDASMPWLMDSFGTGNIARLMGQATVTATSLVISVITGILVSYYIIKWLEKARW